MAEATPPAAPALTASQQSKAAGNKAFVAKKYEEAAKLYSQAIEQADEAEPAKHLLYANLAAAHLASGKLDPAIANCDACLALEPSFAKAHLRKANALLKQGKLELAMAAVATGVKSSKGEASADFKKVQDNIRRAMGGPSADQKERMQMNQAAMVGGGRGGGTREEIQELQMRYETAQMSCAKLRQEIKNKDYDVRRSEMALAALGQETAEADTATYKQVGRMFMQCDLDEIVADTKTTIAKAKADKERLEKNLVHMERQVKEVRGEIQEIMPRTQG